MADCSVISLIKHTVLLANIENVECDSVTVVIVLFYAQAFGSINSGYFQDVGEVCDELLKQLENLITMFKTKGVLGPPYSR